jgi:lipopolysaccharide biosynthesis regulator YciM
MILIKPLMAIAARRRLAVLYQERDSLSAAIDRARKRKKAVSGLYEAAQHNNKLCLYWEGFLR